MPNPTVDLNLGPPPPAPTAGADPLGTIGSLATIQNQLNQNRLFQQSFAARQAAGKVIASAPDMATAATQLQKDPQIAGFYPEIIGTVLGNQKANLENQGIVQGQSQSALEALYKSLGAAQADPSQFDKAMKVGIAGMPPEAAAYLKAHGDPVGTIQGVLGPLAKNDPDRFHQVLTGLQLGVGIAPSNVFGAAGNVPPTLNVSPGGGAQVIGGTPGRAGGGPGAPAPAPAPAPGPAPLAADGTPLLPPDSVIPKPRLGINGLPIRSEDQQKLVDQQVARFDADQPKYDAAAQSTAQIDSVLADIRTMAKGGGFLTTGAGGQLRLGLAKVVNAANSVLNPEAAPPLDPEKVAAGESALKGTTQLGFQLSHQMFGGQHQAYGLVTDALHAVPSIDNTPLGAMLVGDLLKAGSQWTQDQRAFKQAWLAKSGGDLTGSDTAYATLHPPSKLVQGVLGKYGLSQEGFKSAEDVKRQFQDGLLSRAQAKEILSHQFNMGQ